MKWQDASNLQRNETDELARRAAWADRWAVAPPARCYDGCKPPQVPPSNLTHRAARPARAH